ncbi:DUF4097 family beta strand repeat protein [Fibrella sp. HMF5335]|uniref:DUF4097 family beta strand repeat protein n=1 Tax=Fibrella rubiginis TaxID=2817060 RepID=A0A939GCG2_9BACT|nr:DUF4097 family beta strand repeat-containing protein [Fibrella rubiginis]MBO0935000.1 DUF4097 family beta strand repeat protein [Fibrella rubiginis]
MNTAFVTQFIPVLLVVGQTLATGAPAANPETATTVQAALVDDNDDTPYKTLSFTNINLVRAQTSGGGLTVEGGSGNGVKVEMFIRGNNGNGSLSKDEIEERLKDYEVSIRQEGNTVVAIAKQRSSFGWNWKRGLSISFKFTTPRNMSTNISTSGGGIKMSHLTGKQRFETSGGGINLTDLKGDIEGNTSGGGIKLTECRDRVVVETSGGSIDASNSSGNLKMHTSGGGIRISNLNGIINVETSGGSITGDRIDGELKAGTSGGGIRIRDMAGSIDAETSAGSVEVNFTRVDKYVKLETSAGSVRVQMPMDKGMSLDLSGSRVSAPLSNFSGSAERDRIVGKTNGGGIPVVLSATAGSVSINQQ